MDEAIELYRPSNGTEGEWFHARFCYRCAKFPHDSCSKKQCRIFIRAQAFDTDDKQYPKEWRYVDGDVPTCTAFKEREKFNAERRAKRKPRLIAVGVEDLFGSTTGVEG